LLSKRKRAAVAASSLHQFSVMQHYQRSKIMSLSWQIQRRRKSNRSKSLIAAWAIFLNDDITVYYLVRKHSHEHYRNKVEPERLTLFN
jgi:hypothetical protein